jgi:protein ERP2
MGGAYQVCFSNEFSTFSHKIVYLDIRTGEERPLLPVMNSATALTQVSKYIH